MKKLFEKMSFPMLLMIIVSLTRVGSLLGQVKGLLTAVKLYRTLPMTLCNFVVFIAPFVFALILILEKTGEGKSAKKVVGITAVITAVCTLVTIYSQARVFLANPALLENIYEFVVKSPAYSLLVNLLMSIMLLKIGFGILKDKGVPRRLGLLFGICVFLIAYTGIIASFENTGKLLSSFYNVLYFTALFYLPRLYDESKVATTAINGKKVKVLLVVLLAMGILYGIGMGSVSDPSGGSGKTNTCASCGRTYQAGDPGKNFINIAQSGMCNNCENNYHTLKPFLGK